MSGMQNQHDPDEIRELLSRRDREGLTYRELSEESGIPIGTLSYWRARLRRRESEPLFEELRIVDEELEATRTGIEVIGPRGHRVRFDEDASPELITRILAALPC